MRSKFKKLVASAAVSGVLAFSFNSAWAELPVASQSCDSLTDDVAEDTPVGTTYGPEDVSAKKGSLMALAGVVVLPKAGGALLQTRSATWKLEHLDPVEFRGDDNQPVHLMGVVVSPADGERAPTLEVESLFADVAFPIFANR